MERIHIEDSDKHIGEEILLSGWVSVRRDHGKLIFIDLRDVTGKVQMVVLPEHKEAHEVAEILRPEWVIEIQGLVKERPEKMRAKTLNGNVEIEVKKITILNESETPPFEINEDTLHIDETQRLKYRYLDLRTERMQRNMKVRSEFIRHCREYLFKNKFTEFETPLLTKSTAEGSRDFVVPSRLHRGKFYALPQSPQQYKEMLMTAGFERYFQIARAIRDEDLRADRGFEHTQIDIEMSFVDQKKVMNLTEKMMIDVLENMGYDIRQKPFPQITYKEAIEKYNSDKFDLREESEKENKENTTLAFAWVVDFPLFEKEDGDSWTFSHNPFSLPKAEYLEDHLAGKNTENILSTQYDLVCNGFEVGGGSMRAHRPDVLKATYRTMGYDEKDIEKSVGHMLEAYKYGTPPHGGIALGVERILMNILGEDALREVQAFPMTRGGQTSVMDGPNEIEERQLEELGISIKRKE